MAKPVHSNQIYERSFNNLTSGLIVLTAPTSNDAIELAIPLTRRSNVWCDIRVAITRQPPTISVDRNDSLPLQLAMYNNSYTKKPSNVLAKPVQTITFARPEEAEYWLPDTAIKNIEGLRCFAAIVGNLVQYQQIQATGLITLQS